MITQMELWEVRIFSPKLCSFFALIACALYHPLVLAGHVITLPFSLAPHQAKSFAFTETHPTGKVECFISAGDINIRVVSYRGVFDGHVAMGETKSFLFGHRCAYRHPYSRDPKCDKPYLFIDLHANAKTTQGYCEVK